jgi:hypothetical protein
VLAGARSPFHPTCTARRRRPDEKPRLRFSERGETYGVALGGDALRVEGADRLTQLLLGDFENAEEETLRSAGLIEPLRFTPYRPHSPTADDDRLSGIRSRPALALRQAENRP